MTTRMPYRLALAIIAALALVASGCGTDDETTDTDTETEEGTDSGTDESTDSDSEESTDSGTDESTEAAVSVSGAWGRTSPMMADAGAAYMVITAEEADRLISASVDASVAGAVELHETVPVEDGMGDMADEEETTSEDETAAEDETGDDEGMDMYEDGDMPMDQAMTMVELADGLELPAGEAVNLEPGGYHVMLLQLAEPLVAGETFDLTLTFETAGTQVVSVEVRDNAP